MEGGSVRPMVNIFALSLSFISYWGVTSTANNNIYLLIMLQYYCMLIQVQTTITFIKY